MNTNSIKCKDCDSIMGSRFATEDDPDAKFACMMCGKTKEEKEGYYICETHQEKVCDQCHTKKIGSKKPPVSPSKSSVKRSRIGFVEEIEDSAEKVSEETPMAENPNFVPTVMAFPAGDTSKIRAEENMVFPSNVGIPQFEKCGTEMCIGGLKFSTDEKYDPFALRDIYQCFACKVWGDLSKGYYACKPHQLKYCEPCALTKGVREWPKQELLCPDCPNPLSRMTQGRRETSDSLPFFTCFVCKKGKSSREGFYGCSEHAKSDMCENCFVEKGGEAIPDPQIMNCSECPEQLRFSVNDWKDGYSSNSTYNCNKCRKTVLCKMGAFRCMNHNYGLCEDCFQEKTDFSLFLPCPTCKKSHKTKPVDPLSNFQCIYCQKGWCDPSEVFLGCGFKKVCQSCLCFFKKLIAPCQPELMPPTIPDCQKCAEKLVETTNVLDYFECGDCKAVIKKGVKFYGCMSVDFEKDKRKDHTSMCKSCFKNLENCIKQVMLNKPMKEVKCTDCKDLPLVFSKWPRFSTHGGQFQCNRCKENVYQQTGGMFFCILHDEDICKKCFFEIQNEEEQYARIKENDLFKIDQQTLEKLKKTAQIRVVNCKICVIKKPLSFCQTEINMSRYTRKFKCCICSSFYYCNRGFFNCEMDHAGQASVCIDCFLSVQLIYFSNKNALKCDCTKPLVNSIEDRYGTALDEDIDVLCNGCQRELNSNKGFYRCQNNCYGLCATCYNTSESKIQQLMEIRNIVNDKQIYDQDNLRDELLRGKKKLDPIQIAKEHNEQIFVKHQECDTPLKYKQEVKNITCGLCYKAESQKGFFYCDCKPEKIFNVCMDCYKLQKAVTHLVSEIKQDPTTMKAVKNQAKIEELMEKYAKKCTRQRMKYVKSSFVRYFQNPLSVYENHEDQHFSFFVVKKIDYNNSSKVLQKLVLNDQNFDETPEKLKLFIKSFDFKHNEIMPEEDFNEKKTRILKMFKTCKSFENFQDSDRRKLLFKYLMSQMSKKQAETLCIEIFEIFKKNCGVEAARNSEDDGEDRTFSQDLFTGIQNKGMKRGQAIHVQKTTDYELIKYVNSDGELKQDQSIYIGDYSSYIIAMTGECLFQVVNNKDLKQSIHFVDLKNIKKRQTPMGLSQKYQVNETIVLFKKFLFGDMNFENEDYFVVMELKENSDAVELFKVKKEHPRDNVYIIPNPTILRNEFLEPEQIAKLTLEDLNLTFLYEQIVEKNDNQNWTQIYLVTLKDLKDIQKKYSGLKRDQKINKAEFVDSLRLNNLKILDILDMNEADQIPGQGQPILSEPDQPRLTKLTSIVTKTWEGLMLGQELAERVSNMDFTRDGKNAIIYTASGLYHMDLTKFKPKDSEEVDLKWFKYQNVTLQKEMFLYRDNFIFDISKLDKKIVARQFTNSEFDVANDPNNTRTMPSLINRGFSFDDRYLLEIMRFKNEVRVLGMGDHHLRLRVTSQKVGDDGRLDDEPDCIVIEPEIIHCSFPVVASVDSETIRIQSFTQPTRVNEIKFDDCKLGKFITFLNFRSLDDICMVDKRTNLFSSVPFDQQFTRIAFLTSKKGLCKNKNKCLVGDIQINMLEVDPYSKNMKFQLHQSPFESCMQSGIRDNLVIKSYAIKAISDRGTDVVLVCQYNNCVIFDCVTSTVQTPIKIPHCAGESTKNGSNFQELSNDNAVRGSMVKVELLMDNVGSLYWVHRLASKSEVVVFRHNPKLQMSNDDFIRTVWQTRAVHVYFFLFNDGKFYFMDQTLDIKMLVWNEESNDLQLVKTLQYVNSNMELIEKNNFDKFLISQKVLHNKDHMFYLLDINAQPSETFKQSKIMRDKDKYRIGPFAIDGSSMALQLTNKEMILFPLGDQSNIDFLPVNRSKNQIQSFTTFVGPQNQIISCYGGKVLLFSETGRYLQQIQFPSAFLPTAADFCLEDFKTILVEKLNDNFSQNRFELDLQPKDAKRKTTSNSNFIFKHVGKVSSNEMRSQFDKKLVDQYQKGTYENSRMGEIVQEINRHLPVYWINKQVISTFIWTIKHGKGILFFHNKSHAKSRTPLNQEAEDISSFQSSLERSDNQLLPESSVLSNRIVPINLTRKSKNNGLYEKCDPILFSFDQCWWPTDPEIASLNDLEKMTKKFELELSKIKKLTDKYLKADQNVLLQKFEQSQVMLVVNEQYYILRVFSSVVYIKKDDLLKTDLDPEDQANEHVDPSSLPKSKTIHNKEQQIVSKCLAGPVSIINVTIDKENQYIDGIHTTGVDHLIQIVVYDFESDLFYVITQNLITNKQHSLYQGEFYKNRLPTNYLIKSFEMDKANQLNYVFDRGAIVNLDKGIPIQYLDEKTQHALIPDSRFGRSDLTKRLSYLKTFFLDTNNPGRLISFISLSELLYWQRFKILKQKHEIYQGNVNSIFPLLRAPQGTSILYQNLSNPAFIQNFCNAIYEALERNSDDYFHKLINLSVLYSNPILQKENALTYSIENNIMTSFSEMIQLLTERTDLHVTSFFKENLDKFIDCKLPGVNDLLNQSFVFTEQYDEPVFLATEEKEIIISCDTTFINDTQLQQLIDNNQKTQKGFWDKVGQFVCCKKEEQEEVQQSDRMRKQMKVRVLDFNWLSDLVPVKNGAPIDPKDTVIRKFVRILAHTKNDSVFATQHVRILVDYLWKHYYYVILYQLFLPYILFFLSFHLLVTWFRFSDIHEDEKMLQKFRAAYSCSIIFGTYIVIQEGREFFAKSESTFKEKLKNYLNFWNFVDFFSIALAIVYILIAIWIAEHERDETKDCRARGIMELELATFRSANLIGCVAILLIWTKLFYWMRLFESFAAFIRMIQEMIVSSKVFFLMLLLLWVAFANVFVLIQKNRAYVIDPETGKPFEAIFSVQSGVGLVDATIYTYLVGLGEFDTDNFNQTDIGMNWVIFVLSTYIIQLVFMNVLIALMSDAYARVKEIQDQSVLKEQVSLMENYSFLISKEKLFKDGNKYLLHIVSEQVEEDIPQTEKNFAKLREVLSYKTETSEGRLLAKIGQNEEQIRSEISIVKTNMTAMKEDILKQIQNVLSQGRGKGVPASK